MQRDVAGFFSQPLQKQIARDREEVTFYRGDLDGYGRGPRARKRLGSDVFGFAAFARQVQREAVHVRSIFLVKGTEVHLSAVSIVTPIYTPGYISGWLVSTPLNSENSAQNI